MSNFHHQHPHDAPSDDEVATPRGTAGAERLALLRDAGLRVTASRLAVLDLVERSSEPLTHPDVVTRLADSPWNRSTLYRNLIDLTEAGLLGKTTIGGLMHFERLGKANACAAHPHFVCVDCGIVTHLESVTVRVEGAGPRSLASGDVQVQLRGRCDACA